MRGGPRYDNEGKLITVRKLLPYSTITERVPTELWPIFKTIIKLWLKSPELIKNQLIKMVGNGEIKEIKDCNLKKV
jgi:hypothetical protein